MTKVTNIFVWVLQFESLWSYVLCYISRRFDVCM